MTLKESEIWHVEPGQSVDVRGEMKRETVEPSGDGQGIG